MFPCTQHTPKAMLPTPEPARPRYSLGSRNVNARSALPVPRSGIPYPISPLSQRQALKETSNKTQSSVGSGQGMHKLGAPQPALNINPRQPVQVNTLEERENVPVPVWVASQTARGRFIRHSRQTSIPKSPKKHFDSSAVNPLVMPPPRCPNALNSVPRTVSGGPWNPDSRDSSQAVAVQPDMEVHALPDSFAVALASVIANSASIIMPSAGLQRGPSSLLSTTPSFLAVQNSKSSTRLLHSSTISLTNCVRRAQPSLLAATPSFAALGTPESNAATVSQSSATLISDKEPFRGEKHFYGFPQSTARRLGVPNYSLAAHKAPPDLKGSRSRSLTGFMNTAEKAAPKPNDYLLRTVEQEHNRIPAPVALEGAEVHSKQLTLECGEDSVDATISPAVGLPQDMLNTLDQLETLAIAVKSLPLPELVNTPPPDTEPGSDLPPPAFTQAYQQDMTMEQTPGQASGIVSGAGRQITTVGPKYTLPLHSRSIVTVSQQIAAPATTLPKPSKPTTSRPDTRLPRFRPPSPAPQVSGFASRTKPVGYGSKITNDHATTSQSAAESVTSKISTPASKLRAPRISIGTPKTSALKYLFRPRRSDPPPPSGTLKSAGTSSARKFSRHGRFSEIPVSYRTEP
ncbi:hypothetical protein AcV5_003268 [Taiwanofungus camphoratus]|nr:hypothetical protein AcV5_003268 [Antrodia cinnamomea]